MTNGEAGPRPVICILEPGMSTTGALMAARREAQLLADRAWFVLILPSDSHVDEDQLPEFDAVERIPLHTLRRNLTSVLLYAPRLLQSGRALSRVLEKHHCQRLQVNDFYLPQTRIARLSGYRGMIVTWVRCDYRRLGAAGRWWLSQARRASDEMVAVSRFIASILPPRLNARVIYDPAPIVFPVVPHGQNFLFVGNYIEGKGQDMALRAFHRLADDYPDARLTFAGSTMGLEKNRQYRAGLENAATNGPFPERVSFLDFQADLRPLYSDALAALNCSISESFSFTCLEASAHGLPVIATRCGGPEEIVEEGESGFLIDVDDSDALADRMRQLLKDDALARRMGAAGAALVRERFSEEAFRTAVADVLKI